MSSEQPKNLPKCVVPLPRDNPRVAVAAVPFLSESDLRHLPYESEVDRNERYREWFKAFYADCVAAMPAELPKILMGHLFVQGGRIGNSERNCPDWWLRPLPTRVIFLRMSVMSLVGHLHRPQTINGTDYPIRYSGSPIPLRFNETGYRKKLYLLELANDNTLIRDEEIDIPYLQGIVYC